MPATEKKILNIDLQLNFCIEPADWQSIQAVCETEQGIPLVLDRRACRIYMLSEKGTVTKSIGRRGQGPGEFTSPNHLFFDSRRRLIECEDLDFVSIFSGEGGFLTRLQNQSVVGPIFMNDRFFLGFGRGMNGRDLVSVDDTGKVLTSYFSIQYDEYSVDAPDETGRNVMFNYWHHAYTPSFLTARSPGHAAMARSDQYRIVIIDEAGKETAVIEHAVEPDPFSPSERKLLEKEIRENKNLPLFAQKGHIAKIPKFRSPIQKIFITSSHLWVLRTAGDLIRKSRSVHLDLFGLDGKYKGRLALPRTPFAVTGGHIYYVEETDNGFIVERWNYTLK